MFTFYINLETQRNDHFYILRTSLQNLPIKFFSLDADQGCDHQKENG